MIRSSMVRLAATNRPKQQDSVYKTRQVEWLVEFAWAYK